MSDPLYPDFVRGVRMWSIVEDERDGGFLLAGAGIQRIWRPGQDEHAVCAGHGEHLAPTTECTCGIHAYHPFAANAARFGLDPEQGNVAGVIRAWGRVEVHLRGFRAEHARIESLFQGNPACRELVEGLAQRYGADVIEAGSPAELRSRARELSGISSAEARRLVFETAGLRMLPVVHSWFSRGGEIPIAVSGFEIDEESGLAERRGWNVIPGLAEFPVAGVSFHARALQSPAFLPSTEVCLVFEPDNEHDPRAIAVYDATEKIKVGYVPRATNRRIGFALRKGYVERAFVQSQYRDLETGRRTGIRIVTSPVMRVDFVRDEPEIIHTCDDGEIPF